MSEYQGLQPDVVDVLERFGLVTSEQADRNLALWEQEMVHAKEIHERAEQAFRELPRRRRWWMEYGFGKGAMWWKLDWSSEHDPLDHAEVLAYQRAKEKVE